MKILVTIAFLAILVSLGSALMYMMRGSAPPVEGQAPKKGNMATALAFRVGFFRCPLHLCVAGLENGLDPAHRHSPRRLIDPRSLSEFFDARSELVCTAIANKKAPKGAFLLCHLQAYIQYTRMYRPNHTTSTKCQYQAAPSKPK